MGPSRAGAVVLALCVAWVAAAAAQDRRNFNPDGTALAAQTRRQGGELPPLQALLDIAHVQARAKVDPATRSIAVDYTLTLSVERETDRVQLDLYPGYRITGAWVDGRDVSAGVANDQGLLTIASPRRFVPNRTYALRLRYHGQPPVARRPPWEGGVTWRKTPDGADWVDTSLWGGGCDLLWPCIDHPVKGRLKAADLYYTVPAGLSAPGNGRLVGVTEKAGWTTFHWRAEDLHSYGMVLDVAPYRVLRGQFPSRYGVQVPMEFWYLPGEEDKARALFAEFPMALHFYERHLGPYPWYRQKMGVVRVPLSGLENQTLNGYSIDYPVTGRGFDPLMHHEFAHEFFANGFLADYDDLWLHEGLGSYMQVLLAGDLGGQANAGAVLQAQREGIANERPLVSGRVRTEQQVYLDAEGPRGDVYVKGSWVAHTLRGLVGEQVFFDALRMLVYGRTDPRPGNFGVAPKTTADFIAYAEGLSGRELGWFFDVYLREAALPKVAWRRDGEGLRFEWIVPGGLPFPMPLEVEVDGREQRLEMRDGHGTVACEVCLDVSIDPHSRVLLHSDAVDRFQRWKRENGK